MRLCANDNQFGNMNKQTEVGDSGRPKVLVNNFMLSEHPDRQKSKSVLFSSKEINGNVRERPVDKRSPSLTREDVDINKSLSKGQLQNGFRSSRKGSDTAEDVQSPGASLPRKSSWSRTRRVSVRSNDSRTLSRAARGRSESMSSDSTDDCSSILNSSHNISAWNLFEDHVRSVHVSSEFVGRKSRISFSSSDIFQKTMTDLYGNPVYGYEPDPPKLKQKVGNITNVASRLLATTRRRRKLRNEAISEVQERPPPSKTVIENAKRGWRVIRRYVHEMIAEKKGSNAAFNWNMLKQTMKGLTDMDRARIDMYKRYGVIPTVLADGTTIQENSMLSEKARAASAKSSAASQTSSVRPARVSRNSSCSRMSVSGVVRSRAS